MAIEENLTTVELGQFELSQPKDLSENLTPPIVVEGKAPPPEQLILLFSPAQWEDFLLEWGHYQKTQYELVVKLGGAYDYGVDVAGFKSQNGFLGNWDNYQCKRSKNTLTPKTALIEIGKTLWHIFSDNITTPDNYFFFAPKDCGPSLKKLLLDSTKLKEQLFENWEKWCAHSITSLTTIKLDGEFLKFVNQFDFSIFKYKPREQVIEEHAQTPYHAYRFFKTLPSRPPPETPPDEFDTSEAVYISQLNKAYADHLGIDEKSLDLEQDHTLKSHFIRQRINFYFAESLHRFSRDSVPPGTYEALKEELYNAVVDIADASHNDGLERLRKVTTHAQSLGFPSNLLHQVMRTQDKGGMCHQLANENKITWV